MEEGFWQFMGSLAVAIAMIVAAIIEAGRRIGSVKGWPRWGYMAVTVIIATAALIMSVYLVLEPGKENLQPDSNIPIKITYPGPGDLIETPQTVKGVSGILPKGRYAWVLSRFKGPGEYKYWAPQEEITNLTSWEIKAWVGGATEETGNKYEIAAVTVDADWDEYLHYYKKYADDCNKTSISGLCYPGMPLPESAQIKNSIEVIRK